MKKLSEEQVKQLIEFIASHYVDSTEMVYLKTRKREVVDARFMCFYVLKCFEFTLQEIADVFNFKTSNVCLGIKTCHNTLFLDKVNRQIAAKAIAFTRKMLKSCDFNKNLWLIVGLLLKK